MRVIGDVDVCVEIGFMVERSQNLIVASCDDEITMLFSASTTMPVTAPPCAAQD
jgi:hypothetical protein